MSFSGIKKDSIQYICDEYKKYNKIDPHEFDSPDIKRGLRNANGTGVIAGPSLICDVEGYVLQDGKKIPAPGKLYYRGIEVQDIVRASKEEDRYCLEEIIWLLLIGELPNAQQLRDFQQILAEYRQLPDAFEEDMILKAPSNNVMNKMASCILALYSYDEKSEDLSLENILNQSLSIIAKAPTIMATAYQAKRRTFEKKSMYLHHPKAELSMAQNILRTMRKDKRFDEKEARILDLCLVLHAEHGGGNNSTFATRVVSSSLTDTYSSIAASIGSLKGPRHGGANIKVCQMVEMMKEKVDDPTDDEQVLNYLKGILDKQEGDKSGLIYGMGHAVYTLSDPRATILKSAAKELAEERGVLNEFLYYEAVERLAPQAFQEKKGDTKTVSANVDMYSGFVYHLLDLPEDVFTPLFAVARMGGWSAHRLEEMQYGRIIRPAYNVISKRRNYVKLADRERAEIKDWKKTGIY